MRSPPASHSVAMQARNRGDPAHRCLSIWRRVIYHWNLGRFSSHSAWSARIRTSPTAPSRRRLLLRARSTESTGLSILRVIGQVALMIPIVALPWLFGGVRATDQIWLFGGVAVCLACCLAWCLNNNWAEIPVGGVLLVLLAALGLGFVHQVPIFHAFHERLAPSSARLWSELVPSTEAAKSSMLNLGISSRSDARTISLDPGSTRQDLVLLAAAAGTVLGSSWLFRNGNQAAILIVLCAANGAALAFFGIAQQLQWNGKLFGAVVLTQGGTPFASFVNRNHAAGFLNLSLATAIGLCIWSFQRDKPEPDEFFTMRNPSHKRWRFINMVRRFVADLNLRKLFSLASIALIVAGLLSPMSRGGWIAAACAASVTIAVVSLNQRVRIAGVVIVVALICGFALVEWLGRTETIRQRFATLWDQNSNPDGRLAHWKDGLRAVPGSWLMGSGLGTYRSVYRIHQTRPEVTWFYHAENQYLEALVEGGVLGLGLMLGAISLAAIASWRLLRSDPIRLPMPAESPGSSPFVLKLFTHFSISDCIFRPTCFCLPPYVA